MKLLRFFLIIVLSSTFISCKSKEQNSTKKHLSEKEIKENNIPTDLAPENAKRKVQNILNKRDSKIQIRLEKARRGK